MEQIGYQIVHSIAGRIRIRVHWLETDAESASKYQRLLEALSYVNNVRINPFAQSIVILYNEKQLTIAEAEELFVAAMQQVKLTPPMQTTTIETEPPAPSPEPVSEPVTKPSATPPKSSTSETEAVISDIPSPWDEEDELEAEPTALKSINDLEPTQSIDADQIHRAHSTSELAQRLGVTSQAITRRRTKADFETWTQAQDPEKLAWHYDEASRSFYPVRSSIELQSSAEPNPSSDEVLESF